MIMANDPEDLPEPAGHRTVPHTADTAIEAWAPGKDECIGQAVRALVETFIDPDDAVPTENVTFSVTPVDDEDFLVSVLDEAIYQIEVFGRVPVDTSIDERTKVGEGRADVWFATVPADDLTTIGATPKAISLHQLAFARTGGLWRCHVTIDV